MREGIVVKLIDEDGRIGFGEVAPIPWFPVESIEAAEAYLSGVGGIWDDEKGNLAESLPCTSFALSSARHHQNKRGLAHEHLHVSGLLPAGKDAVGRVEQLLSEGFTTFKWKIGVYERESEWRWAEQMFRLIHGHGVLRLDANGGLSEDDFHGWGRFLSEFPVEFVEQPLAVGLEKEAIEIGRNHSISVAFDESVCQLDSLERLSQSYPDAVFVIKPSQMGDVQDLLHWARKHRSIRRVYSSAFETDVGFKMVFDCAADDSYAVEACGFGGAKLIENDGLGPDICGPLLPVPANHVEDLESLWKQL